MPAVGLSRHVLTVVELKKRYRTDGGKRYAHPHADDNSK